MGKKQTLSRAPKDVISRLFSAMNWSWQEYHKCGCAHIGESCKRFHIDTGWDIGTIAMSDIAPTWDDAENLYYKRKAAREEKRNKPKPDSTTGEAMILSEEPQVEKARVEIKVAEKEHIGSMKTIMSIRAIVYSTLLWQTLVDISPANANYILKQLREAAAEVKRYTETHECEPVRE